jgi:hypothetical protein
MPKGVYTRDGGRGHSELTKKKISSSMTKIMRDPARRECSRKSRLGAVVTEETRKKMSEVHIGKSMPFKGRPWTDARRRAQSVKRKRTRTMVGNRAYPADWPHIRTAVYERDRWTCQECGAHCHGNGTKDKIQCHHIDYNIDNIDESNLITLCASCHGKTSFGKDDWQEHFQSIERNN